MSVVSMKQLLEAGVHFGHQTRRWDPKMKPYIFTQRNDIYIIDLQKTIKMLDDATTTLRLLLKTTVFSCSLVPRSKLKKQSLKKLPVQVNTTSTNAGWVVL